MKKIFYFVFATLTISCSTSENTQLESTKIISEFFNKSEINDLQLLLNFFSQEICTSKDSGLNKCYEKYCSEIDSEMDMKNGFNPKINYNKQLDVYTKINQSTFNKIWKLGKSTNIKTKEEIEELGLNYNGEYLDFIEKYGENNDKIYSYYESIKNSGDISPVANAIMIKEYKSLDILDVRTKLIIAIHYLTFNDKFNRKEKQ